MSRVSRHRFFPLDDRWLIRVAVALILLYLIFGLKAIWSGGLFSYVGNDYRAFHATAQIVREQGFPSIYDLALQGQYQRPICERYIAPGLLCLIAPLYYLPPFVLPMLWPAWVPPGPGFLLWTGLTVLTVAAYLYRLWRQLEAQPGRQVFLLLLLSLPLYFNLFFGQVSHWLLIPIGESWLAFHRRKDLPPASGWAGCCSSPSCWSWCCRGSSWEGASRPALAWS